MGKPCLMLTNVTGIWLDNVFITPSDIQEGITDYPKIGEENRTKSDEQLFTTLCAGYMPIAIHARVPTILRAQFTRFLYAIDGIDTYQCFSCRLTPEQGFLVVAPQLQSKVKILEIRRSAQRICFEIGDMLLSLEVYTLPYNTNHLGPLSPPLGYRREILTGRPV